MKITTYLNDGAVFRFTAKDKASAQTLAGNIIKYGYVHTVSDEVIEYYPAFRVIKVRVTEE